MIKIRKLVQKKVYLLWIISYICILLIFVLMGGIFYYSSSSITRSEINRTNHYFLTQLQQAIDDELSKAQLLGAQIAADTNVQEFMHKKIGYDELQRMDVAQVLKVFSAHRQLVQYDENFFVGFRNIDMYLMTSGQYEEQLFYQIYVTGNQEITEEAWEYLSNDSQKSEFVILSSKETKTRAESRLAYVLTAPHSVGAPPLATVVVPVDNKRIFKIFESIGDHVAFIIDEKDRILFSSGNSELIGQVDYAHLSGDKNLLYYKNRGSNTVYSYISSEKWQYKYVIAMPTKVYEEKLIYLKIISIVCIVISCFAAIVAAATFLRKNYKPVNEIVHMLQNVGQNGEDNEFSYISGAIKHLLATNQDINDKLDKQHNTMKYFFLASVLKGRIQNQSIIEKGFSTYQIKLLSANYSVILFLIEDIGDVLQSEDDQGNGQAWDLLLFAMRNVIEEITGRQHLGFVAEINDMICSLVNLNPKRRGNWEDDVFAIAKEAKQFFQEHFHISMAVTVSEVVTGFSGIEMGYRQALDAMDSRLISSGSGVTRYSDIGKDTHNQFYQYDLETEKSLIGSIVTGNFDAAAILINNVFDRNFNSNVLSVSMTKLLIYELLSTILKAIQEVSRSNKNCFINEINSIRALMKSEDVKEVSTEVLRNLKPVCEFVYSNKASHNDKLLDRIQSIIHDSYSDANLSSQYLSNEVGVTVNYLLRFFKEQMGIGLVDYLHGLRVQKAKELLETTTLSINEIGQEVGYWNSNSFIRAFKKSEGITPGSYRDSKSN